MILLQLIHIFLKLIGTNEDEKNCYLHIHWPFILPVLRIGLVPGIKTRKIICSQLVAPYIDNILQVKLALILIALL